ncbi:MAG TPA: fibronectin type III domain-containing protein [Anaeromyxobacter sp.]|nr:fibronectin type III domain-containing protein [Anaeromyxobacter sp.]
MRRALLLVVLVAAPALATAQTPPGEGEVKYGSDQGPGELVIDDAFINIDECNGSVTAPLLELLWNTKLASGSQESGNFKIYVANDAGAPTADPKYCKTEDDPNASPKIYAGQVGSDTYTANANQDTGSAEVSTRSIMLAGTEDAFDCNDASLQDRTLTVCVHYIPGSGSSPTGSAVGTLTLSVRRPPAPPWLTVGEGEDALNLSWGEPTATGTQARATSYRVVVSSGGTEFFRDDVTARELRVGGLSNGTPYDVAVYGLSAAMNESTDPMTGSGTPGPVLDFWEYYSQQLGGKEEGGCGTGGAGPLALLAISALLAGLRRRA